MGRIERRELNVRSTSLVSYATAGLLSRRAWDRTGRHRANSGEGPLSTHARVLSNTSTLRVCALNSMPTKWIGSPSWRYLAA